MHQKQQTARPQKSQAAKWPQNSEGLKLPIAVAGGLVAILALGQLINSWTDRAKYPLKNLELSDRAAAVAQKAPQTSGPRYGLEDVRVRQNQTYIILRDIGAEDGDIVTLKVNGQVLAANVFLRNGGNSVLVNLHPGSNLVEIIGIRDGVGGITLAADVSTRGNLTRTPFPPGATAQFNIIR